MPAAFRMTLAEAIGGVRGDLDAATRVHSLGNHENARVHLLYASADLALIAGLIEDFEASLVSASSASSARTPSLYAVER